MVRKGLTNCEKRTDDIPRILTKHPILLNFANWRFPSQKSPKVCTNAVQSFFNPQALHIMGTSAPPAAPPPPPSFLRKAWSAVCTSFVALNLILVIAGSILIIYDPDTFCITPMMPDSDYRTACDKNYVCEALRGVLNVYAFALLLISSLFIFVLFKQSHMVRVHAFFHACKLNKDPNSFGLI